LLSPKEKNRSLPFCKIFVFSEPSSHAIRRFLVWTSIVILWKFWMVWYAWYRISYIIKVESVGKLGPEAHD
jgi:hypothetical protein